MRARRGSAPARRPSPSASPACRFSGDGEVEGARGVRLRACRPACRPARICTVRPATPLPASVSRPETSELLRAGGLRGERELLRRSVLGLGLGRAGRVRAAPVPGVYGVALRCQTCVPSGTVNAFVSLSVRWTIFMPSGERPDVPVGQVGRRRADEERDAAGHRAGVELLHADRERDRLVEAVQREAPDAASVPEPAHALAASPTVVVAAASGAVGEATRIVPSSGIVELRMSAATALPVAVPTTEPTFVAELRDVGRRRVEGERRGAVVRRGLAVAHRDDVARARRREERLERRRRARCEREHGRGPPPPLRPRVRANRAAVSCLIHLVTTRRPG